MRTTSHGPWRCGTVRPCNLETLEHLNCAYCLDGTATSQTLLPYSSVTTIASHRLVFEVSANLSAKRCATFLASLSLGRSAQKRLRVVVLWRALPLRKGRRARGLSGIDATNTVRRDSGLFATFHDPCLTLPPMMFEPADRAARA
jgi:hypothetical protein